MKTEHEEDKPTWKLSMLEDDRGSIFRGTAQAEFLPALRMQGLPHLLETRDSAFPGTDLLLRLRKWNADVIVLAGIQAHNCIAQTAADAFRVIHVAGATASRTRKRQPQSRHPVPRGRSAGSPADKDHRDEDSPGTSHWNAT